MISEVILNRRWSLNFHYHMGKSWMNGYHKTSTLLHATCSCLHWSTEFLIFHVGLQRNAEFIFMQLLSYSKFLNGMWFFVRSILACSGISVSLSTINYTKKSSNLPNGLLLFWVNTLRAQPNSSVSHFAKSCKQTPCRTGWSCLVSRSGLRVSKLNRMR